MEKTRTPGVYHRGDSYVAVVAYKDSLGRWRHKWITRATMREVLRARRTFLDKLDKGFQPETSRMTIEVFLTKAWLPQIKETRRQTYEKYESVVRNHVIRSIGHLKLQGLTREHLRNLYRPLTPSVRRSCHAVLSSALGWAVQEGLVGLNAATMVRGNRSGTHEGTEQREARHLDADEAKRLLKLARGHRLEGGIILGLVGGLREAEVCAVRWRDIDSEGVLTVRESYWGPTKSGRFRSVPLPESGWQQLRRFKADQARYLLKLGVRQTGDTFVVHNLVGGQTSPGALNKSFGAFTKRHGFPVTFHGLRHTCAILLLIGGVDVQTAAGWLGHSPTVLLQTYAHYVRSAAKQAAARLDAILT